MNKHTVFSIILLTACTNTDDHLYLYKQSAGLWKIRCVYSFEFSKERGILRCLVTLSLVIEMDDFKHTFVEFCTVLIVLLDERV